MENLQHLIIGLFLVFGVLCFSAYVAWLHRGRMKEFQIGKGGIRFVTRGVSSQLHEINEIVWHIDREARRKIRDHTSCLDLSIPVTDLKLEDNIKMRAAFPLLLAASDNHHTREVSQSSIVAYHADKVVQVKKHLGIYREYVSDDVIERYVAEWLCGVVHATTTACLAKIDVYSRRMNDAEDEVKGILHNLIEKNQQYIKDMQQVNTLSSIQKSISGIHKMPDGN